MTGTVSARGGASPRARSGSAPGQTAGETTDEKTHEIRREIERTRDDMSETVNAIQERLSPRNIATAAASSVRDRATGTWQDVAESDSGRYVRANPIPATMVCVGLAGLAWLAFAGREPRQRYRGRHMSRGNAARDWRRGSEYFEGEDYDRGFDGPDYGPGYQSASMHGRGMEEASAIGNTTGSGEYGTAGRREDRTRNVTERAGEMAAQVRRRARRARTQLQRTWQQRPLLVGAVAAMLGLLVGLTVPETEVENEWMGEARDGMIDNAQESVRNTVQKVQNAAQNAIGLIPDEQK
jgi:ElaB/YqjD/DUF883 family membrane-anchored ribosome-binding protein